MENVPDALMKMTVESVCSAKTRQSLEKERKRNAVSGKDVGFH